MTTRALIYGTIAIDTLITPLGVANSVLGGSGSFAALAARLITNHAHLFGVVGSDFPPAYWQAMEGQGVNMQHVSMMEGETFAWTGKYEDDMNIRETVRTVEGVQESWQPILADELRGAQIIALCNVTPRLQYQLLEQSEGAQLLMVDFMKSWIERERDYVDLLLSRVDMALMNDEEALCFAGGDDLIAAAHAILAAGPRYAIVKHGSEGASLFQRSESGDILQYDCPAWPLEHALDPTGAGDSFMGALAAYLVESYDGSPWRWDTLQRGMQIAATVAAATCESFGTDGLLRLSRQELAERLVRFNP